MTEPEPGTADRHASWLELFFDLVVVVAVSQLAHLLHEDPGGLEIVSFFTLYLAIWLVWTTYTLYSNIVAEKVHVRAMFLGMAGIATMAATVSHATDGGGNLFAGAFLYAMGVGTGTLQRTGRVLLSWAGATQNFGLVPWILSFWVADPWWKLGLWLLGLCMTVAFSVLGGGGDQDEQAEQLARLNERLARRQQRRDRDAPLRLVAARLDGGHFGERLGLFVIIVLGEAMLQVVGAVADLPNWWPGDGRGWLLLLTVTSAFLLLAASWGLNVRYGFAEETRFPPRLVLPAHFAAIASITATAAGLGSAATEFAHHLAPSTAWLTCGGTAVFLLIVNLLTADPRWWAARAGVNLLPVVAGVLAPWLPAAVVVAVLAAAAAGQLWLLRTARPITSDA